MALIMNHKTALVYSEIEQTPAGNVDYTWNGCEISEDGEKCIAVGSPGHVYIKVNGVWSQKTPGGSTQGWRGCDINNTGCAVVTYDPGRIFYTTDFGDNWTELRPKGDFDGYWQYVKFSSDGTKLIVCESYGNNTKGRIYTSNDSGQNWTEQQPAGNTNGYWYRCDISSDGSKFIVSDEVDIGKVFYYNGSSWSNISPAGGKGYGAVSLNFDGSIRIAGVFSTGRLYKYNSVWNEIQPAGNVDKMWISSDLSNDGYRAVVCAYGGRLYGGDISDMKEIKPAGDINKAWSAVAINSTGNKLLCCNYNGRLYLIENF